MVGEARGQKKEGGGEVFLCKSQWIFSSRKYPCSLLFFLLLSVWFRRGEGLNSSNSKSSSNNSWSKLVQAAALACTSSSCKNIEKDYNLLAAFFSLFFFILAAAAAAAAAAHWIRLPVLLLATCSGKKREREKRKSVDIFVSSLFSGLLILRS